MNPLKKINLNAGIDSIKIFGLEKKSNLIHGFSSRGFIDEKKNSILFRFGRVDQENASPEHVRRFLHSLQIESDEAVLVRQVHGDSVYVLEDPETTTAQAACVEADAIVTRLRGRPVGVLTADCIPVIVYDARQHVVGVIHAGRKGTAENIVAKTLHVLKRRFGGRPEDFVVGMGPGIGACCYEVDDSCLPPFRQKHARWETFCKKVSEGKYMLDLFLANTEDSLAEGVPRENIFRSGNCTACEPHRFFSYRKEGSAGRLLSLAMLR